jgi:regulator of protease activity HflC (stomatin/prohibitin superfamily)
MSLEDALTSRDHINAQLRTVLDEATGKWGIRVSRVELKSIDPPGSIQEAMEKQMRAERDRRAAILNAEGTKQSQVLTAEGEKQAAVLTAEGEKQAAILRAEGQAKAIQTVFGAIHQGRPDRELLSYQYLQMLPQLAQNPANKIFVIPSEFTQALGGVGRALGLDGSGPDNGSAPPPAVPEPPEEPAAAAPAVAEAEKAAQEAAAAAEAARTPGLPAAPPAPPEPPAAPPQPPAAPPQG